MKGRRRAGGGAGDTCNAGSCHWPAMLYLGVMHWDDLISPWPQAMCCMLRRGTHPPAATPVHSHAPCLHHESLPCVYFAAGCSEYITHSRCQPPCQDGWQHAQPRCAAATLAHDGCVGHALSHSHPCSPLTRDGRRRQPDHAVGHMRRWYGQRRLQIAIRRQRWVRGSYARVRNALCCNRCARSLAIGGGHRVVGGTAALRHAAAAARAWHSGADE